MRLSGQQINELFDEAYQFINQRVRGDISLSSSRDAGHDRHFATVTYFLMTVKKVMGSISGAHMVLYGEEAWHAVGMDNVVAFEASEGKLRIVEQFEQQTERISTFTLSE